MQKDRAYIPTVLTLGYIDTRKEYWLYRRTKMNYTSKYDGFSIAVHFIVDGHHKMAAAAQLHHPINILSYFVLSPYIRRTTEIIKGEQFDKVTSLNILVCIIISKISYIFPFFFFINVFLSPSSNLSMY